jgi:hypothetical protein
LKLKSALMNQLHSKAVKQWNMPKMLLNLVAKYPDTVKRLAKIRPEELAAA